MSNIKFLNRRAKAYHNIINSSAVPLLIVQSALGEMLMTQQALEALKSVLDDADRQSVQCLYVLAESAARLGYSHCWTAEEVLKLWGPSPEGA